MSTVYIYVGIPASGKSTAARAVAIQNPNTVIVCRDDIRISQGLVHGQNEDLITRIHRNQIEAALLDGMDVIVADTNVNKRFRDKLVKFAHEHGADVQLRLFNISLREAVRRDASRKDMVGPAVIERMYAQMESQDFSETYLPCPRFPKMAEYRPHKPDAIVVDIDGTLAHKGDRSPYDESKVSLDTLNEPVAMAVDAVSMMVEKVIIVSGRTEGCRVETETWLDKHGIPYDTLYMRAKGDQRPDYIIKNEIYDEKILPYANVLMAFDDRDQVVRHVRARGIPVFQVAPGRF